jgi:surface antigen
MEAWTYDSGWARGLVVALFDDREEAEQGIRALQDAGFPREQIGVAMRDRTAEGELIQDTGTRASEGAAAGLVGGGILGGILGLLVGVGALVIPGVGPVVAGGALASALGIAGGTAAAGAGIGAATGGVIGSLIGAGIPEEEARYFELGFEQGGTLVTVSAGAKADQARQLLAASGADLGPTLEGARAWSGTYERRHPNSHGRRRDDIRGASTV